MWMVNLGTTTSGCYQIEMIGPLTPVRLSHYHTLLALDIGIHSVPILPLLLALHVRILTKCVVSFFSLSLSSLVG